MPDYLNIARAGSGRIEPGPLTKRALMACAIRLALPAFASTSFLSAPALAQTQTDAVRTYDIPPGPLSASLVRLASEAGFFLSADAKLTEGKRASALKGMFTVREALDKLLEGSGLEAMTQDGSVILRRMPTAAPSPNTPPETLAPEVPVTASREHLFGDLPPEPPGFEAEYQSSSTKSTLPIRQTPQSISVITRESMDQRQVRDVNSALELAAGVTSSRSGNGGPFAGRGLGTGENFNLRGQELNENRDIRVDGFVVPSNPFDTAAYVRIEAVKGPSSMLYGQGSIGGFINLVRKKPQAELGASIAGGIASFDTYRAEGDITGPLGSERVLGRMTLAYEDGGSFTDGVETRIAMIAPSLDLKLGDRTRALVHVMHQDDKYVPSQGVPLVIEGSRGRAPDIPRERFIGIPSAEKSKGKNTFASVQLDHELSDKWLASLFLHYAEQDQRRFFDSYGYSFTGLAGGNVTLMSDTAHLDSHNWAGELRLDGSFTAFGREHRLLVGLETNQRKTRTAFGYTYLGIANIYVGNFADFGTIPGGAGNQPFLRDDTTQSTNKGAYAQLMLSITERTKLLAGIRHDQADQEQRNNIAGGAITDTKRDSANTYRVGLTQDLWRNVTAYAAYAESFNPVGSLARDGQILDPEKGKGIELGVKTEWLEQRLFASAAIFRQELTNRPITDPVDPNFSVSSGRQLTKGLELEVSGSPYRGVTIGAAAAWLDNRMVDPQDPDFGLKPYDSVDRIASVFAGYELQGGPLKGLGFGVTYVNIGKRSLSFAGNGAFYGSGTDELFVDGYERVDLNLSYNGFPGWNFAFQIRNLTDEVYIERVRDASGSNYFGAPRSYLFRASYKFR